MTPARFADRQDSGFTLLELLVVISILGLILVALTSGVRFAGQAWEIQQRQSARSGDLDAVQNVVRQLIASGNGFTGDADTVHFVGTMPRALARAGLYDIELRTADGKLVLAWQPHFKGASETLQRTQTPLTGGVLSFAVSYYAGKGGWQTSAKDKSETPALLRIALELDGGRSWPPFIAAPMVEVQPGAAN